MSIATGGSSYHPGSSMRRARATILILPTTDSTVRTLRRIFSKSETVAGRRLGGQQIGKRWVEDAYVYRIS